VLESAAVGSPDVARGEIVKAFVKLSEEYGYKYAGASQEKLAELVLELQVS
jgi:acyl-coenzyme A synthetase/AMP-(fatty) acid ligase